MSKTERISSLAYGSSAHPSSSVSMRASPVSHREAGKLQQSSSYCICFKSFLGKLFYTLQFGGLAYTISMS